ncbi:MAG TPA: VOC family protein [Usitatibacter sp.]|jgi:catechol 2,3-dioxygenase-like lactoylglutathione lyase family enzyme|nr:VOC family protein [Usitatibacter sp.]
MAIEGMNHFNVLTDDVEATRRFYCDVLGLTKGERPPFSFDGLWLYAGGRPILHVSARKLGAEREGVIDHIAFTCSDLRATTARLDESGIKYSLGRQVGTGIWQLFCRDPAGARVELDFDPAEPAP